MINSNSVYEYAVVRFMPFIETREFANVGIVLIEPKEGRLIFKVSPKRFGRVTNFFEEMDKQLYKQAVESFLLELVGQRALFDFLVVCDDTNNTPTRIDRNELYVDIAIEPVKSVEFIYIPLRIKNTGEIAKLGN